MKIIPFKKVIDVSFGDSKVDIISKHGKAERESENSVESKELVYSDKIFRFRHEAETLHEVTLNSEYFDLDGREIGFAGLGFFIAKNDTSSFKTNGFLVSPKYGLAFDPHDKYFLTVFCQADLERWRD